MVTWKLKNCPKCKGDLYVYKDLDECWYELCLQCGYTAELKDITGIRDKPTHRLQLEASASEEK